jgi:hypothetical protein
MWDEEKKLMHHAYSMILAVFQNSVENSNSDTSESVVFLKIRCKLKKSVETKLSHVRNTKNIETQNSAGLTELSTGFSKKLVIFQNFIGVLAH